MKRFDGIYTGPYFDSNTPTNITAQLGSHAYLPCKVRQLGNKSVSVSTLNHDLHKHTHTQPKHPITPIKTCPTSISLRRSDNTIRHESVSRRNLPNRRRDQRDHATWLRAFRVSTSSLTREITDSLIPIRTSENPSLHQLAIVSSCKKQAR